MDKMVFQSIKVANLLLLIILPFHVLGSKQTIHSHHWYGSLPHYTNDSSRSYKILIHHVFTSRFNLKTRLPDWVAYELNPHIVWGYSKQRRDFKSDPFLKKEGLVVKDYEGASRFEYDKGHLAPLGSFKGSFFIFETQYLTNIIPQKKKLNRILWKRLEDKVRVSVVLKGQKLKILTGPLYSNSQDELKPYKTPPAPWNVEKVRHVPSGSWKIISVKRGKVLHVCSLIMPQDISSKSSLKKYIKELKVIKMYTGLVIFKDMKIKETCLFLIQG